MRCEDICNVKTSAMQKHKLFGGCVCAGWQDDTSPVHVAALQRQEGTRRLLLEAGADKDAVEREDGWKTLKAATLLEIRMRAK